MGYYSYVTVGLFESFKSGKECEAIKKHILTTKPAIFGDLSMIEECLFEEERAVDNGKYIIYPDFEDNEGKWYGGCEESLALLISILIAPDTSTLLEMRGEDNEMWGYRIKYLEIVEVERIWREVNNTTTKLTKEQVVEALI